MSKTVFVALAVVVVCITICYMSRTTEHKVRHSSVATKVVAVTPNRLVGHKVDQDIDSRSATDVVMVTVANTKSREVELRKQIAEAMKQ